MPGRLKPFWRMLAQSFPLKWPRARLRSELGADVLALAESLELVDAEPIAPGDGYPCRCPQDGCAMRVFEDRGLLAVCGRGSDCADERLPEDDAVWVRVTSASMAWVLQRALRLEPRRPEALRGVFVLGERMIGATLTRFVLAPRPRQAACDGAIERLVHEVPDRHLVVLTFDEVPAAARSEIGRARVEWISLAQAFHPSDPPRIDLAAVALVVASGADVRAELWPRYVFVADPERWRFAYAGRPFDLARQPIIARLLVELLRRPGKWVPRKDLLVALYADEAFDLMAKDPGGVDRRLRQAKSDLTKVFASLGLPAGVPADPIENLRARSDLDGGYRIDVGADRVLLCSP